MDERRSGWKSQLVRRWPSLRHFVTAAILVAIAGPIIILAYVKSGLFDVAAARPHSRLVEWITHETMINSIKRRAPDVTLPATVSADQAKRGFCKYEEHCVECHGAPAVAREQWVNGLNPTPPYLLDATHLWKPHELEWIVRNGIKMTGMPAWRESMSDGEIQDVVGFVEAMSKMPPQTYVRWRTAGFCGAQSSLMVSMRGTAATHQSAPKAATAAVTAQAAP
jgi:mono/diheme cytochrome c family protein